MPSRPEIDSKKCTQCGLCVRNCPTGVLEQNSPVSVARPEDCIGCKICERACAKCAIRVKKI